MNLMVLSHRRPKTVELNDNSLCPKALAFNNAVLRDDDKLGELRLVQWVGKVHVPNPSVEKHLVEKWIN